MIKSKVRVGRYKTPQTLKEWTRHKRGKAQIEWGPWKDPEELTEEEKTQQLKWKREPEVPAPPDPTRPPFLPMTAVPSASAVRTVIGTADMWGYTASTTTHLDNRCHVCRIYHPGKTPATHWAEQHQIETENNDGTH